MAAGDPKKVGIHKLKAALLAQPPATPGYGECPARMKGEARKAWIFLAEQLETMRVDKRPDVLMLEGVCENYAGAILAERTLRREGQTIRQPIMAGGEIVVDHEGQPCYRVRAHPAVVIAGQRWNAVRAFCTEFGLSPVSRTRLSVEKGQESQADLMELLSAPREPRQRVPIVN